MNNEEKKKLGKTAKDEHTYRGENAQSEEKKRNKNKNKNFSKERKRKEKGNY